MATNFSPLAEWQPLEEFLEQNPQFTENQIRWQLRYADENGLIEEGIATKLGKRWYLNIVRFPIWMARPRKRAGA